MAAPRLEVVLQLEMLESDSHSSATLVGAVLMRGSRLEIFASSTTALAGRIAAVPDLEVDFASEDSLVVGGLFATTPWQSMSPRINSSL